MIKQLYNRCTNEVADVLKLADSMKKKIHIITVFDNPYTIEAPSGMIYPSEMEDIEAGFSCSATNYTGYMNYLEFVEDVKNNKYSNPNLTHMVYSTAQIGKDINRRSYIPLICKRYSLINLTCDAYRLCLLMDKSHHFTLLKPLSHIPKTVVYWGQTKLDYKFPSDYVILKPSLECAAVGVKKVPAISNIILEDVSQLKKQFNQNIIIQEYIDGLEVSVPVLKKGNQYIAMPPVWVQFKGDILTFDSVDGFQYKFAILPDKNFPFNNVIPSLMCHAESIMQLLGTDGLTRVDYRIKNDNEYFVFDIAALPVLANTGTCMQSFKYLFSDNNSIFKAIIGSALINQSNN